MATLNYTVKTWNGTSIDGTGNITAKFLDGKPGPHNKRRPVSPVEATTTGRAPSFVRAQPQPEVWELYLKLAATDETDIQSMLSTFVEGVSVYLRANDGAASPTTLRIACSALAPPQRVAGAKNFFYVPVRVPDPTWEEDSLTTNQQLNQTASPIAVNTTNNGTREAPPAFTFYATVAKGITSILDDATYSLRGFFVNRSPKPLNNVPVWLFDSSAAAARLATNSSFAGATIKQTSGATTITADIAAGASSIAITDRTSWPTSGLGYITDSRADPTDDQFYYTGLTPTAGVTGTLTGVVWLRAAAYGSDPGGTQILAGGIAHTVAQVTSIAPSGIHGSGDDLRVALDDDPNVKRSLVAWGSGASDVVIHVTVPEAIKLTLSAAMTASVPAIGSALAFVEGVTQLPPQGFLAIGDEIVHYSSKSGNGVVLDGRGLWQTTAASHATTVPVYANPHRYVVSVGWARADVAPEYPLAERAACQLPASNNLSLRYGDQADDPSSVYFDRDRPQRAMSWRPGFASDGNTVALLMSISPDSNGIAGGNILTFKDDVPGDGSPAQNFAELTVPLGIRKGNAAYIVNDWTPEAEVLNLELWTRDINGQLKLQDQLQQVAAAAARALPAALTLTAYGVQLKGRANAVTGAYYTDTAQFYTITNAVPLAVPGSGMRAQQFVLDQPTPISGLAVRLALDSGVTAQAVDARIYKDSLNLPDSTDAGLVWNGPAISVTSTTAAMYPIVKTPSLLILPAGTYWLVLRRTTAAVVNVRWYCQNSTTSDATYVPRRYRSALYTASWDATLSTLDFKVRGAYDASYNAVIQNDMPMRKLADGARTGLTASFDKTILSIEPLQSVYVHRNTAFVTGATAGAMFHLKGTLASTTSGDSIAIDKWLKLGSAHTFVIDCKAHTVVYLEDAIEYPVQKAILPADLAVWLSLLPGANALTYTDASLVSGTMSVETRYRGARV